MLLRLTSKGDSAIVYRATGPTVMLAAVTGVASIGGAVGFYAAAGEQQGPGAVFYIFAALFGLAGAMLLLRLPAQVRRANADGGVHHVVVDRNGLAYTPNLGAATLRLGWNDIAAVLVAESFELIERDERGVQHNAILVLLKPAAIERLPFAERVGAGIGKSGEERLYFSAGFPRGKRDAVLHALRRSMPPGVPVHAWRCVRFDRKQGADTTEGPRG